MSDRPNALRPLRAPSFGRLLAAYGVNEIGDSVATIALALLVYAETGSAWATTALFVVNRFLPALAAPLLTARLDQLGTRRVLVWLYLAEAVTFVFLALAASAFILPAILVLAFVDGTLAISGRALVRAVVAKILTPLDMLRDGNALLNFSFAVASVTGMALGAVLVSAADASVALYADAASFAAVAAILARAHSLPAAETTREPMLARLKEGLGYLGSSPVLRWLIVGEGLALFFFTLVIPIEVVYATETLGTNELGFGAMLAAWSLGIVVGSAVFVRIRHRPALPMVALSTSLIGLAYVGMSLTTSLAVACALSLIGGTGNGIQWVAVMTLVQERTAVELQARVVAVLESVNAVAPGLSYIAGGALTALISPPAAYAVAGGGVMLLVVAGLISLGGRVRRAEPAASTPRR